MNYSEHYSEKIHDYLDGTLGDVEEASLLGAIATSAELRDELRHAIALKAAFKADVQALTPPPHLTNSIFANLGFISSGVPHHALPNETVHARSSNTALASVLSSLLTAVLLLSWNLLGTQGSKKRSDTQATFAQNNAPSTSPLIYWRISSAPRAAFRSPTPAHSQVASMLAVSQFSPSVFSPSVFSSSVFSSSESVSSTFPLEPAPELFPEHESPQEQITITNNSFRLNTASELVPMPIANTLPLENGSFNTQTSEQESWLQRVQIHARRIVSTSLPATEFPSNPSSFLRNTALAATFKLSERHSVGVECSEETFYQRFQERLGEGESPVTIQQNPSLFWAGISYRYLLLENPTHGFNPFLQGLVGGTQLGATGRVMLGLNYSPDAKTEFTLGLETSALVFLHQGVLYASPKLGFSYGVSLRF